MSLYSIVVPVYNSEQTLQELYARIKDVFETTIHQEFELILVDDFSKDASYHVMESLHKKDNRVKIIQLARNCGQHNALLCGFSFVSGEFVVTMDDDLQHPPEEIEKLITHLNENDELDVVIGSYETKKHSWYRNIGSKLSNLMTSFTEKKGLDLKLTSFRLMRIEVVKSMLDIHIATPRVGYLLLQVTNRIANVTVQHDERKVGRSQYTFKRLVLDFFNNLFTNSVFPLIFVRNIGIASLVFSIVMALFYSVRYFVSGISIKGWTTIILLQLLFSGLILFAVGIVGEYLMRIINEAKKMPNYYIRAKKCEENSDEKSIDSGGN